VVTLLRLRSGGWLRYASEQSISKNLICPVCTDPFLEPVMIAGCEHIFCSSCISMVREPLCPVDRTEFDREKSIVPAPKIVCCMVDELVVHCVDRECPWEGPREALMGHVEDLDEKHRMPIPKTSQAHLDLDKSKHEMERLARDNVESFREDLEKVNPSPSDVVTLNVGGLHLMTSRKVLCSQPKSKLASLFSGGFPLRAAEDGTIFLDRNGESFSELIKWLRDSDDTSAIPQQAVAEAKYWEIRFKQSCCRLPELTYSETLRLVEVALRNSCPVALPKLRMSGFYFGGLNLNEGKFRGSCLRRASFAGASLLKADFRDCDLTDADFDDAVLDGANFEGAKLQRASFSRASVRDIILPAIVQCKCNSTCAFGRCNDNGHRG
jgi:hypothetical protein